MILHKNITGYQVGDDHFERGLTYTDDRGITLHDQAYNLAARRAEETGGTIIPQGDDSVWDPKTKQYV